MTMIYDLLAGSWTYRSFVNQSAVLPELDPEHMVADDVKQWSGYLFGQGVMTFHPTVTGGLTGVFEMGTAESPLDMHLNGKIEERDGTTWIKWNAHGLPGTPSDGWLYEYDAHYTAKWPDGSSQIDAIVGSVVRSQTHGDLAPNQTRDRAALRGATASFLMVRPAFVEAREVIGLPPEMLEMVGSRHHRLHHALWHGLRDYWNTPGEGDISKADKLEIARLGWEPPHPSQFPTRGTSKNREPDNGAGEDFLFMHRQMIHEVRELLDEHGLPMVPGWKSIPTPNRRSGNLDGFSVPQAWDQGKGDGTSKGLALIKSDEFWQSRMTFLERKFKDPKYLATLSLDQLGQKIEWLVHNQLHMRWCSLPRDPKTTAPLPGGRPVKESSDKWIKVWQGNGKPFYYDDLNDAFSSHVNPLFWRLHGWVDDRIEDWFEAHAAAHPGQVTRTTVGSVPWFAKGQWVGLETPWVGPTCAGHGPGGHTDGHEHGDHAHDGQAAVGHVDGGPEHGDHAHDVPADGGHHHGGHETGGHGSGGHETGGHGNGGHGNGGHDHGRYDVEVMQRVYDLIFNPEAEAADEDPEGAATRTVQFTDRFYRAESRVGSGTP
ncbi:hypothetical protein [Streptomyces sp. NPDC093225]|uniref:hypothetical protein n=1 Tax=Streptomyces sp. NPDC093225 TaxID=3366034 RepID=UPI0037F2A0F7